MDILFTTLCMVDRTLGATSALVTAPTLTAVRKPEWDPDPSPMEFAIQLAIPFNPQILGIRFSV